MLVIKKKQGAAIGKQKRQRENNKPQRTFYPEQFRLIEEEPSSPLSSRCSDIDTSKQPWYQGLKSNKNSIYLVSN